MSVPTEPVQVPTSLQVHQPNWLQRTNLTIAKCITGAFALPLFCTGYVAGEYYPDIWHAAKDLYGEDHPVVVYVLFYIMCIPISIGFIPKVIYRGALGRKDPVTEFIFGIK